MIIDTDEWTTGSEAARLLGCTPQRVMTMGEEGSLDVIRPWPRVALIGRVSVAEWLAGKRPPRITPVEVRRYVLATTGAAELHAVDINEVRDHALAFILEARPRWDKGRQDLWALTMASQLWNPRPGGARRNGVSR